MNKIRLLMVEDQRIIREITRKMISDDPNLELIGEASNGDEALTSIDHEQPDLVLLDFRLEPGHGLEGYALIKEIRNRHPSLKIITITAITNPYTLSLAFEFGANSIICKDEMINNSRLIDVIQKTIQDERCLPQIHELSGKIIEATNERHRFEKLLNATQHRVLHLLAKGQNNKDIAKKINKSEGYIRTIKSQLIKIACDLKIIENNEIEPVIQYYKKLYFE